MDETLIQAIEKMASEILITEQGDFLVLIRIKPTNNVKIYIDNDGAEGMTIDKCVRYNRALYKKLEETPLFPDGNFSLEVSSPGLSEPLVLHRQYVKNKGRFVEVTFKDGSLKEGKLIEVTENDILIMQSTGKGKKAESQQFIIPFENIKSTTIQIQF